MTPLARMLSTWDEAALTGLVSKGVVIRAGKDAAAATVEAGPDAATVIVGDATVTLAAPDLKAARCTCGLPFPCRHVVAAVLAARRAAPADARDSPVSEPDTDIAALPFDEVEKHAGKDWPRALALTAEAAEIGGDATRIVTFPETGESVTFPVGLPLKQALFKGAKPGRTRLVTAAAALILARAAGRTLPEALAASTAPAADLETLARAEAALHDAARALSAGALAMAADRLFTLAISTRAEAVPRLAAELRGLSRRLTDDALRQADETPETLLLALGRTHALTRALRTAPDDPALVGTLARSFSPSGPMDVAFLGAERWRTPAGARGLTMAFLDLATRRIHRATEARAAGTDLTYDPNTAWDRPLWSAMPPSKMANRVLHLPDAAIAPDGGLGLTQVARDGGTAPALPGLTHWSALPEAFDAQMGRGLRQRGGDALLLLAPQTTESPVFDPYAQRWTWPWIDADGAVLPLILPQDMASKPEALDALTRRVERGLVALSPGGEARGLALWLGGGVTGHFVLQFDRLPEPKGLCALVDRVRDRIASPRTSAPVPPDPLRLCLDRAAEAALAGLNRPTAPRPTEQARALGLGRIADGLEALDGEPEAALRLAYLLSLAGTMISDRA